MRSVNEKANGNVMKTRTGTTPGGRPYSSLRTVAGPNKGFKKTSVGGFDKTFHKSTPKLNGASPLKMPSTATNGGLSRKTQSNAKMGKMNSISDTTNGKPYRQKAISKGPTSAFKPPKTKTPKL